MNDTPILKIEEKTSLSYMCPWSTVTVSSICREEQCRFWSKASKDCRWNLWLQSQIFNSEWNRLFHGKEKKNGRKT